MQYEKRLISIFTPSVLTELTCLSLIDQKELGGEQKKTQIRDEERGERGPRRVRGKILCFSQLYIYVLKPRDLIPW